MQYLQISRRSFGLKRLNIKAVAIFNAESPTRDLCTELMSHYICSGKSPGTLLHRVLLSGYSPMLPAFSKVKTKI